MDSTQLGRELCRFSIENNSGPASTLAADFNVTPPHAMVPARAQRLHGCLFGGKTRSKALRGIGLRFTILDFALGEDPVQKALAITRNRGRNPRHFFDVDAGSDNHWEVR